MMLKIYKKIKNLKAFLLNGTTLRTLPPFHMYNLKKLETCLVSAKSYISDT